MMENRFERFHPLVSFLFYAGSLALIIFMLHPVFLIIGFLVIFAINYAHDRLKGIRSWLWLFLSMGLLITILNPLFNERGRYVLFEVGQHKVTLEAITYGGMNALSMLGIIALFVSYNVIMKPNKLLFLFSKFLPQFAILLMLTMRFIPLMKRRLKEISVIQKSKGITVSTGKWMTRVQTAMLYIQTLLTYSLEEAIQTADSMKARGYGQGPRSTYDFFRFRRMDVFAIVYLLIIFAGTLFGRFSGYGYLTIYPMMESWQLSLLDARTLIFYLLFLSFPLFVEVGAMVRWRLSNVTK
ncbi:MAG: cobalt transporter [Neobacillus sp.]|nr:cobalt transporter [Neobacillus sp.]